MFTPLLALFWSPPPEKNAWPLSIYIFHRVHQQCLAGVWFWAGTLQCQYQNLLIDKSVKRSTIASHQFRLTAFYALEWKSALSPVFWLVSLISAHAWNAKKFSLGILDFKQLLHIAILPIFSIGILISVAFTLQYQQYYLNFPWLHGRGRRPICPTEDIQYFISP